MCEGSILSLAALEDAGWRLGHEGNFLAFCRGDLFMQADPVDNVYWLFGLEGLGKVKRDLVADRVCGLEEIELDHQQVRRPLLLPEEHPIHRGRSRCRRSGPSRSDGGTSSHTFRPACGARPA